MAEAILVFSFEAQSIGEVVHTVAVLFAVDELALICAGWLFESAFAVELPVIEGSEVLVFLFLLFPAQPAVCLASVVVLPIELVSVAEFFALAVELIPLELALVREHVRLVLAFPLCEVVLKLSEVIRTIREDKSSLSFCFSLGEVANVERVVVFVQLAQSMWELCVLYR